MPDIDWAGLFAFTVHPLELAVRGSAVFWFLFLVFRTLMRRDFGSLAAPDVLVLMLIADAAQNAMAGQYRSIADGLVLLSVILGWNLLLDWACFVSPRVERLIQPAEVCLVRDGRPQCRALRREFISMAELRSKLRENGVEDVAKVKRAYLEADGSISVIKK